MAYRTYLPTTQSVRHVKSPREQGNSIMFTVDDDVLMAIQNSINHGTQTLSSSEILDRIEELLKDR
jgi:hypothetical protein